MVITIHGVHSPFFKGVTKHGGVRLVFFGPSLDSISKREQKWLEENSERLTVRSISRPALRLIRGGKGAAA